MAYRTVLNHSQGEVIEKKSRFIGQIFQVTSEEEAKKIISAIKKEHHQANHSCSAYRVRGQQLLERYNDDGEPGGTAGMPMLDVLRGNELENVLVVVTRYFGGTKLGTGGLVRAYTQSAQAALGQADLIEVDQFCLMMVTVDYGLSGKVEYKVNSTKMLLDHIDYGQEVAFSIHVSLVEKEDVIKSFQELTNGSATITTSDPMDGYILDGKVITGAK